MDTTSSGLSTGARWARRLSASAVGWTCAGFAIGAVVGAAAVRVNPSLRDTADARLFLALCGAAYALVFGGLGLVAGTIASAWRDPLGEARIPWHELFVASLASALFGFVWFWFMQTGISTFNWRRETNPQNVAISIVIALAAGACMMRVLSRPVGRLALARAKWVLPPLVALGCAAPFLTAAALPRELHAPAGAGDTTPIASAVARPAKRVILIGIDGADWGRIDPLLAAGRLPNFARLCERGARSPLKTRVPTWSPILWNTIATGRPEDEHGVLDFTELGLPGASRGLQRAYDRPDVGTVLPSNVGLAAILKLAKTQRWIPEMTVTALQRRVKSVWNVLSERGVQVGIVRWFASWPAEEVNGYLVSDNDPWSQMYAVSDVSEPRIESAGFTWPPELATELDVLIRDVAAKERSHDGGGKPDPFAHPVLADLTEAERATVSASPTLLRNFDVICKGDLFATATGVKLWNEKQVEFLAVYLRAVDNLSHRFAQFTGVVDHTYEWMDARIGEIVAGADADTAIVIVSDHGWSYDPKRFAHVHGPDGIVLLSGAGVRAGVRLAAKPTILDIAPTLLALFGVPASLEMPGSAISEAFGAEAQTSAALARVPSFGDYRPRWSAIPAGDNGRSRADGVELLRNLGYLE